MNSTQKRLLVALVKWSLFGTVLFFVGRETVAIWRADAFRDLHIDWPWMFLAALCNFAGWLPSVWFWRSSMISLGFRPGWLATICAYYCSHLGKYVPGKATVLVIRAALLRSENVPIKVAAIGATLESLGIMGAGLGITISLAAWTLPVEAWNVVPDWFDVFRTTEWLGPLIVVALVAIAIPAFASLLTKFAGRLAQREVAAAVIAAASDHAPELDAPAPSGSAMEIDPAGARRLLLLGTLSFIPAWFLHGLSLGCVIIATGGEASWSASLMWMGVVSGATSIGFLVLFAPGGLGVREGLIIAALAPTLGKPQAIVIATLMRIVWFTTELVSSGILYATRKR